MQQTIKYKLLRISQWLLIALGCGLIQTACTNDESIFGNQSTDKEQAVQIIASFPDDLIQTRAQAPKEKFKDNDVIHVYALFTLDRNTTVEKYGCMKLKGDNWTALEGSNLNWPWNATNAEFTAYYIPPVGTSNNNTILSNADGNNTLSFNLTELTETAVKNGTDPMLATCSATPAEGAIHLQFQHIFTKLTLVGLGKEEAYRDFMKVGQSLRLSAKDLEDEITFTREKDKYMLSHDLAVQNSSIKGVIEVVEGTTNDFSVTYLLPAASATDEFSFVFYDHTPFHKITLPQDLLAGHHYSIDVTKLADSYMDQQFKEETWNPSVEAIQLEPTEINTYLMAIRDNQEFSVKRNNTTIQILEVIEITESGRKKSVTIQVRDVDFQGGEFTPVNLTSNTNFNGNNHIVKNVKITKAIDANDDLSVNTPNKEGTVNKALFGNNKGTIRNYIVENAQIPSNGAEATYTSILVANNTGNGRIENVQIRFTDTNNDYGTIMNNAEPNNQGESYLGIIAGYNGANITNCSITGEKFTITSKNSDESSTFYIGGLIGKNDRGVSKCTVQTMSSSSIEVNSPDATVLVGGFAGYAIGNRVKTENCSANVDITITAASKVTAGGFVGAASNEVVNCHATSALKVIAATSYEIGGFAGLLNSAQVHACYAGGKVEKPTTTVIEGTSITNTGGFAGWIVYEGTGTSHIRNCYTISKVSAADGGFTAHASEKGVPTSYNDSKIKIHNCFSMNGASSFMNNKDGVTLSNYHHNGQDDDNTAKSVSDLNSGKFDEFSWTTSPALFGANMPYLQWEF